MIKISKYSIKSEAAIHSCNIKKLFWRVLKISHKTTYVWGSFSIKLQPYILIFFFFKKKGLLHMCFPVSFAKYFRGPFLQNKSRGLLLQNIFLVFTSTSDTQCYHWSCFFPFYFKYFQSKHFSFLKVLNN